MKKQNKTFKTLKELGIYKRFDKCVVRQYNNDDKYYYIFLFYENKPFTYWSIDKDKYSDHAICVACDCCIDYYNGLNINARRNNKKLAKYFLASSAGKVVKVYK